MGLEVGRYEAVITGNTIKTYGDKDAVSLACTIQDEAAEIKVYLTPKAMGMARASLKMCGFDCDAEDLDVLVQNPDRLAGQSVTVLCEEYNGSVRPSIWLNPVPTKKRLAELTTSIRAVKKADAAVADDSDIPW